MAFNSDQVDSSIVNEDVATLKNNHALLRWLSNVRNGNR